MSDLARQIENTSPCCGAEQRPIYDGGEWATAYQCKQCGRRVPR